MGEALITSRTGAFGGSGSGSNESGILKTEIFKQSDVFIVPKAKDQSFSVRIFGGGGGGASLYLTIKQTGSGSTYKNNCYAGGGGGWMNNDILILNQGDQIPISIGQGGKGSVSNNTANTIIGFTGGTTSFGTYLSALGGDGGYIKDESVSYGGNGGSGGGSYCEESKQGSRGGIGFQFGGGCGGNGGYGGKWGGGGGAIYNRAKISIGGCIYDNGYNSAYSAISGLAGNGGNNNISAENGINTMNIEEIDIYLKGSGLCAINVNDINKNQNTSKYNSGGGGYGGCGIYYGGGGGYGGNGGYLGGGGGYGAKGGDMYGGGGAYGSGGSDGGDGTFGGGGGAGYQIAGNGGDGICIIQYYPE